MSRYLLLALIPVACAAPDPVREATVPAAAADLAAPSLGPVELPVPEATPARRRELKRDLIAATRAGDYERARELVGHLEELETEPLVAEAHGHLAAGDPETALAVVERALAVAPDGPAARLLHGHAALRVGRRLRDPALLEAALDSFLFAAGSPPRGIDRWTRRALAVHAYKGASDTARALGRREEALELAEEELRWAAGHKDRFELYADLGTWPERTVVECALAVLRDVEEEDPERAAELTGRVDELLDWLAAVRADDPWPLAQRAALRVREERFDEAVEAALAGLERAPDDRELPGWLADAARGAGGSEGLFAAFERFRERHPDAALAHWYPAYERFDVAVTNLLDGPLEDLARAEADFRRCRELEPEHDAACRGFEVMCRNARGWIHYRAGRLGDAAEAFRSMEELIPRGMTWQIEGRLLSGVEGLRFVGDAYATHDDLVAAAEVFLELHRYEPDDVDWANNAGFFHRDAGARLASHAVEAASMAAGDLKSVERRARILEAAGLELPKGADEAAWRRALGRAEEPLRRRSEQMFETSYEAYLAAAALAPDDVRIVNDTALVAVHHLGRDLERAEQLLLRCVELGARQLAAADGMDEEQRLALTEAYGDAHENLGVLYLQYHRDPARAREWFEKSVEIGPYPRPVVTEGHLPRCAELLSIDD